jgi:hypothetical protein
MARGKEFVSIKQIVSVFVFAETEQHSTAQHSTAQHSTAQHSTANAATRMASMNLFCVLLGCVVVVIEFYLRHDSGIGTGVEGS